MTELTLEQVVQNYLNRYPNPNTLKSYSDILLAFVRDFGPKRLLSEITDADFDQWQQAQNARGIAAATLASRTKTLKAFWNWCLKREYIEKNPARYLTVKKPATSPASKAIPTPILREMLNIVGDKKDKFVAARDTAMLAVMITYGARAGDIARLRISYINFADKQLILHVKGGKEHRLPLPDNTAQVLAEWMAIRQTIEPDPAHDYLFVTVRKAPGNRYGKITPEGVESFIKRLSHEACGRSYGPHSIRHWRGQSLADLRVPPSVVQYILGHSDVKITLDHYYNQDYDRVVRVLDETELGKTLEKAIDPPHKEPKKDIDTTDVNFWRRKKPNDSTGSRG